jgi:hypothetical protein
MRHSPLHLTATRNEVLALARLWQAPSTKQAIAKRAYLVLCYLSGDSITEISRTLLVQRRIVRIWLHRFREKRLAGLESRKAPGRAPVFSPGGLSARREACL